MLHVVKELPKYVHFLYIIIIITLLFEPFVHLFSVT